MKKRKFSLPREFPNLRKLPVKGVLVILLSLFILALVIGSSAKFLLDSDYFKVQEVSARGMDAADLSYLKGKNIFSLDLRKESRLMLGSYPDASGVRIVRLIPNRLFVDFAKRTPAALVKLYRYFALDNGGVIFFVPPEAQAQSTLPVITGLETKIFGPKPGSRYNLREIRLSLEIIREMKSSRPLKNYTLNRIDVANFQNAAIFISSRLNARTGQRALDHLEIKLGPSDIRSKAAILGGLLAQEKDQAAGIKYIDLRFKNPVVKYNEGKSAK